MLMFIGIVLVAMLFVFTIGAVFINLEKKNKEAEK